MCTYQPVPMTFPERAINPLAPVSSRSPVPGSTFMVTEFKALTFLRLRADDGGADRRRRVVVNPDVRAESRVWHSLIAGHMFKVSNPERSALKSHGSPLAPPRTCPHCGVSTVKSKAHCPKGCGWRRCLACCLPVQRHNRAPLSSGLAKKAAPGRVQRRAKPRARLWLHSTKLSRPHTPIHRGTQPALTWSASLVSHAIIEKNIVGQPTNFGST